MPSFRRAVAAAAVALSALSVASLVAGCTDGGRTAAPPPGEAESAALAPSDPRLAGLYENSCKTCHTVRDSLAPLTGDRGAWDARWTQGEDALLRVAIAGRNGMPAGGQCFACTPADLRALTRFMAGREGETGREGG